MANNRVKVHLPHVEKGEKVEVLHLGMLPNGSTTRVSDEAVAHWEACNNRKWPEDGLLDLAIGLPSIANEDNNLYYDHQIVVEGEPVIVDPPVGTNNEGAVA